jgi:hypothetical protein
MSASWSTLLQVGQGTLADAIGVHNREAAFQLKFLDGEQVEEHAACFLRICRAQTEIDDARRYDAVIDQLAKSRSKVMRICPC